jgi:hypothetical protein
MRFLIPIGNGMELWPLLLSNEVDSGFVFKPGAKITRLRIRAKGEKPGASGQRLRVRVNPWWRIATTWRGTSGTVLVI